MTEITTEKKCDVCGGTHQFLGRTEDPFGVAEYETCRPCLQKLAVPEKTFKSLYEIVTKDLEHVYVDDTIKMWHTHIDGEYVTWEQYVERQTNG